MNNIPPNVRAFSLEMVQQEHPLCTRDGRAAKFIAYVPENEEYYQFIVCVEGRVEATNKDGSYTKEETSHDLFLAPLGMCEGKPVFAGDVLTLKGNPLKTDFIVPVKADCFDQFQWPSKVPVVETRMSGDDLCSTFYNGGPVHPTMEVAAWKRIANKAIERAIADGDVIPTSIVKELIKSASDYTHFENITDDSANAIVNNYLEGLK